MLLLRLCSLAQTKRLCAGPALFSHAHDSKLSQLGRIEQRGPVFGIFVFPYRRHEGKTTRHTLAPLRMRVLLSSLRAVRHVTAFECPVKMTLHLRVLKSHIRIWLSSPLCTRRSPGEREQGNQPASTKLEANIKCPSGTHSHTTAALIGHQTRTKTKDVCAVGKRCSDERRQGETQTGRQSTFPPSGIWTSFLSIPTFLPAVCPGGKSCLV